MLFAVTCKFVFVRWSAQRLSAVMMCWTVPILSCRPPLTDYFTKAHQSDIWGPIPPRFCFIPLFNAMNMVYVYPGIAYLEKHKTGQNYQERWITRLVCRWRAQLTAWINVNCRTHWTSTSWTHIAVIGLPVTMFVWGSAVYLSSH